MRSYFTSIIQCHASDCYQTIQAPTPTGLHWVSTLLSTLVHRYNTHVIIDAAGALVATYRKVRPSAQCMRIVMINAQCKGLARKLPCVPQGRPLCPMQPPEVPCAAGCTPPPSAATHLWRSFICSIPPSELAIRCDIKGVHQTGPHPSSPAQATALTHPLRMHPSPLTSTCRCTCLTLMFPTVRS